MDNGYEQAIPSRNSMRILVIEDDQAVASYLAKGLKESGHNVDTALDGSDGLSLATSENYDVMIVDRMLPNIDGLAIIRTLRNSDIDTPVLILSALGEVDDRVKGLKAGGDDYLTKPFAFAELLARVDALARRASKDVNQETVLTADDLSMDLLGRKVFRGGDEVELRAREFRLLEYLMRHKGQVVTRTMLLENVWDYHFDPQTNVIDVHISRVRQKVDKGYEKQLIKTIIGAGYMLDSE
jgi:two-component system OmpR family response regulator